jgi:lipoate-protein ligase A
MQCRLILDEAHDGNFNMAADEWLLRQSAETGETTLRFYSWSQPTLSLGYFQRLTDRKLHPESLACPVVRRASGGGAILHDHELTYSFVTPIRDRVRSSASNVYDLFHQSLIDVLAGRGIVARLADSSDVSSVDSDEFLCFRRRSDGDVLIHRNKVGGSAQRRNANCLLQHGSVLVAVSEFARELPGINELSSNDLDSPTLMAEWAKCLTERRNLDLAESSFTLVERQQINRISANRFATSDWLERR